MIAATAITGPERTCLGCRKRDRQGALVRLVADGDRVVIDAARRRPGRGAWVHRDRTCVKRLAVGAIERGLRCKLAPDALVGVVDAIGSAARQTDRDQVQLPSARPAGPLARDTSRPGHG